MQIGEWLLDFAIIKNLGFMLFIIFIIKHICSTFILEKTLSTLLRFYALIRHKALFSSIKNPTYAIAT